MLGTDRAHRAAGVELSKADAQPASRAADTVALRELCVIRDGRAILDRLDWAVRPGERWVVLGPNGSGKTTLLQVAGGRLWPTSGTVEILGHRLGNVDVRSLRPRVAFVSAALVRQLRPSLQAREVVVTGRFAALEPWWHRYEPDDWRRADQLLAERGVGGADGLGTRPFGVISEGERQQVLLARALMSDPELLLLDEPAAGLDLGARERFVADLGQLAGDPTTPPLVLVTHHTEEVPPGFTHAALLREGRFVAAGPLADVLTSELVSACFGLQVTVESADGRWWSRATGGGRDDLLARSRETPLR